jgi:hypothetical protein
MPDDITDAFKLLGAKETVPSEMRTAEWARVPQQVREGSFWMAGVTKAAILDEFRGHAAQIVEGNTNIPEATRRIQAFLDATGYTPAPDEEGTIQDLRTPRRIAVTLATNVKLLQGWAKKERGMRDGAMRAFPAWELVRIDSRQVPREWPQLWEDAGGTLINGRMIALKSDPIWSALGNQFEDSIGVDYPPFMWGSGMGWKPISRREAKELGLLKKPVPALAPPVSSPNATLQMKDFTADAPQVRSALTDKLKGLVEYRDDMIVFTDPNGTRPYAAEQLAKIVTAPLPDGFEQVQARAVERHVNAGLMLGDLTDDFRRFLTRTLPLDAGTPVYRGEAYRSAAQVRDRLKELSSDLGAIVREIAQSWSLVEKAAMAFASGRGLKHRLILQVRKHGTLRPIYQTAELVTPTAAGQKEIVAMVGTRFRMVGSPSTRRDGGVVETRVEVEEVLPS